MPPPGPTPGAAPPRGPRERAPPGVVPGSAPPQLCEPGLGQTLDTRDSRALFPLVLCPDPCCLAPHNPHLSPPSACVRLPGLGSQRACGKKAGATAGHPRPFPVSTEAGSAARERGQEGRGPSHKAGGGHGSGAGGVGSLAPQEDPTGGQRGMRGDVPLGSAASAFRPLLDFSEIPTPHGPT